MRTDHTVVLYEYYMMVFGGYDGKSRYGDLYQVDLSKLPKLIFRYILLDTYYWIWGPTIE
jgi:hypothetical protein